MAEKVTKRAQKILYFTPEWATIGSGSARNRHRSETLMDQEKTEAQEWPRADEHPWLAQMPPSEDEDSVGEVIRYTLDELRFA